MATYYTQLSADDTVEQVIIVSDDDGVDEAKGIAFCKRLFGNDTKWAKTDMDGTSRKRYAGIGYKLDRDLDAFFTPAPFASWVKDAVEKDWVAPDGKKPVKPDDVWDEAEQKWKDNEQP